MTQGTDVKKEAVIASDENSRSAHRELCRSLSDTCIIPGESILSAVEGLSGELNRLHVVVNWTDLVRLTSWKTDPGLGDLFLILRNAGVRKEELAPFKNSEVDDLFPWLYYGKRFDVLRRLCQAARANVERHSSQKDMRVYTHLVSEETHSIVASSL